MTGYSSVPVYYKTIFALIHHHKYSLTEIYEMYPFERDIFVEMIADLIEQQNKQQNLRQ